MLQCRLDERGGALRLHREQRGRVRVALGGARLALEVVPQRHD